MYLSVLLLLSVCVCVCCTARVDRLLVWEKASICMQYIHICFVFFLIYGNTLTQVRNNQKKKKKKKTNVKVLSSLLVFFAPSIFTCMFHCSTGFNSLSLSHLFVHPFVRLLLIQFYSNFFCLSRSLFVLYRWLFLVPSCFALLTWWQIYTSIESIIAIEMRRNLFEIEKKKYEKINKF